MPVSGRGLDQDVGGASRQDVGGVSCRGLTGVPASPPPVGGAREHRF